MGTKELNVRKKPVLAPAAEDTKKPVQALGPKDLGPWVDTFPGIVLAVAEDRSVLYSNRPLARLRPEEALGIDLLNFVPVAQKGIVDAAIADGRHPGTAHEMELALLESGGQSWRWYLAGLSPLRIGGREATLISGFDITEKREELERLRHSEQMLVDTQGITHLGVWYWDISKPSAVWTPELYNIYGLDPKKHVPTYQDYLTRVHPEDVDRVKAATELAFKAHKPYSHDERIRHTDGSWRWLHTWARAITDDHGNLKALMGVCQDITDRKRAEQKAHESTARFQALFDRSTMGVAILDERGVILEANEAFRHLRGQPDVDPAGQRLQDLWSSEAAERVDRAITALSNGRTRGRQLDLPLLRADQQAPRDVRLTLAVVKDVPGSQPFTVAMLEDRSLLEKASRADQLAVARLQELHQVEQASERQRQLLNVASHELKNPLTPVRMQLHMLEQHMLGPLNERQDRAVAVASKQIRRITQLLQDVLDVARIEQGQLSIKRTRIEAGPILERVHEAFADIAVEWGVNFTVTPQPGLWLMGDPDRLEQVIFNLVSNALKFTPEKGAVELKARRDGNDILMQVRDTGPGMDAAQKARLFRAFSQVHSVAVGRQPGTGLGLYIARNIVEAMQGTLGVDSAPGKGSTFYVRLPAEPPSGT